MITDNILRLIGAIAVVYGMSITDIGVSAASAAIAVLACIPTKRICCKYGVSILTGVFVVALLAGMAAVAALEVRHHNSHLTQPAAVLSAVLITVGVFLASGIRFVDF